MIDPDSDPSGEASDGTDDGRRDGDPNGAGQGAGTVPPGAGDVPGGAQGAAGDTSVDEPGGDLIPRGRAKKAPNAFRTISEVADDLHIPQHVLRFWETKFPQVRPLKRGGGRRYYRPDDIALLRRISDLLYIQGYTIKGVQRLLREGGGRLSDDIPPAPADEQAAAAAERASPIDDEASQFAMTHLLENTPSASRGGRTRPEAEADRLRAVLTRTLAELEALRTLLR